MKLLRATLVALSTMTLSACLHTTDSAVSFPPKVDQDEDYAEIYEESTKSYTGIKNFETRFAMHATQLNNRLRAALAKRYSSIYNEPQPLLGEASNQAGYFVSVYVADENVESLDNSEFWNIQLQSSDQLIKPTLVKQLRPKAKWQTFFPKISPWSEEFLILFDSPALNSSNNQQLVNEVTSKLIISGPEGRVDFEW